MVTIKDGIVRIVRLHQEATTYTIMNKGKNQLDFLLNHFFLEDYQLVQRSDVEEEEPVDITDRFYQFCFIVPQNTEKKTFVVREETDDSKEHFINDGIDDEMLSEWMQQNIISSKVDKQIKSILALKKEICLMEYNVLQMESEIRDITSTQDRIKGIIPHMEGHGKEALRYIKSLSEKEDKLTSVQQLIKSTRQEKKGQSKALEDNANAISFSYESFHTQMETECED